LVLQPLRYRQWSTLRDRYPADTTRDTAENLRLPATSRDYGNPKHWPSHTSCAPCIRTNEDYVRTVLKWFATEPFVYTLAPPPLDRDPVDTFLFETRRGFCEHYASAFVVLLRAADIPARVVTGYQGGEMNPRGDYMIVRQSDAHAWAEALIAGEWRRFDPTGAVAPSRIEIGLGGALPAGERVPMLARLEVGWLKACSSRGTRSITTGAAMSSASITTSSARLWRELRLDRLTHWQYAAMIAALALAMDRPAAGVAAVAAPST